MIGPYELLRLVLDPLRLAVLGRAAAGPVDVDDLAEAMDVHPKKVLQAAGKLREAGLLDPHLRLRPDALRELAATLPSEEPVAPELVEGDWSREEADVLSRFFRGRALKEIPASRSKRLVVLERLAQEFEPGIRYPEPEVNVILHAFHPDHATLRRYLVDEGLLTRERRVYWRTGGRVETGR